MPPLTLACRVLLLFVSSVRVASLDLHYHSQAPTRPCIVYIQFPWYYYYYYYYYYWSCSQSVQHFFGGETGVMVHFLNSLLCINSKLNGFELGAQHPFQIR